MKEIMTIEHKDWDKFCDLLEGKEGCNFHLKDPKDRSSIEWTCKGRGNKDLAKAILKKYFPNIDIDETIKYFESEGGYCDCEILFNVDKEEDE